MIQLKNILCDLADYAYRDNPKLEQYKHFYIVNGSHKILRLTIEDVLKIMDIFQKNNRELIFDFRQDYRSFDMEKYINRIARLTE